MVGNSEYRHTTPLINPRNDAALMSSVLTRAGFSVTKVIDADQRSMQAALREFGRALQAPDVEAGLFYYAGHGIQIRDENFLIPVDAEISGEDEVAFSSINLNESYK
ncbi:caspase family protein [Rhizobium bangladeshense]|uniref:caspase family protein n=1 Tax=Rhizobium bangladeshense TaxID=1138189 RepID=UPI001C82F9A5|nr:caspase family protein [Rhizobium bangladeshense]MBX4912787.1 caspase family protein [Rhizobium bangladeshense]